MPIISLSANAPIYERKFDRRVENKKINTKVNFKSLNIFDAFKKILKSPNNSNKSWVWEQYDHTVMADTVQKPGGDSAVI